jgi:homoserine kinase
MTVVTGTSEGAATGSGAPPVAVRVRVPATSANLGPGFDALGLALGMHDEVVVALAGAGVDVAVTGEGAGDVARDASNLLVRTFHATCDAMEVPRPGLRVECTNVIPHGRGLGSSAAAIVAGVVAARALVPDGAARLDDEAVLALASRLEGHPDNVAACLLGGLTIAWLDESDGGRPRGVRLDPAPEIVAVAFVPTGGLSTSHARGLLPASVPHADAACNAGRAALLVEALTRRPDLLLTATVDRLHQQYRAAAMPASLELVDRLRAAGVAAIVSGAGPTVLALTDRTRAAALVQAGQPGFDALGLEVATSGAQVEPA